MPIRTDLQRKALVSSYTAAAPFGALFTADPGATGTAVGEVTGGAPAYARKALTWGAPATVSLTAVATSAAAVFDVPSGSTVAFVGTCVAGTAAAADVRDTASVVGQSFASQGTYTVTATYTQS